MKESRARSSSKNPKFLQNMNITRKLTLVTLTLLVGFVGIGATYLALIRVTDEVATSQRTLEEVVQSTDSVQLQLARSQTLLREFLLHRDSALALQFKDAITESQQSVATLGKRLKTDSERTLVTQLEKAIRAFNDAATAAIEAEVTVGLDETSGLHGAMRQAVHDVETFLNEALTDKVPSGQQQTDGKKTGALASKQSEATLTNQKLLTSMLMLRRHEKDFIQRENDKYVGRLAKEAQIFSNLLAESKLTVDVKARIAELMAVYQDTFNALAQGVEQRNRLTEAANSELAKVGPLVDSMVRSVKQAAKTNQQQGEARVEQITTIFATVLAVVALVAILGTALLSRGLNRSLFRLQQAVKKVTAGDLSARAHMPGGDELASLGNAFDTMLDERVNSLAEQAKENEQLNNSVIQLMDAADRLSKRDLTVVVPVSEDVTGNISDALNLMARETAQIMSEINGLAEQLEQAAGTVRQQGYKVTNVASTERQVVSAVLDKLTQSTATMAEIAQLATNCDELGVNASRSTKQALLTVRESVRGINEIRNSVGETEKSIKRLGERSQEIGGIVEIIKDIAERTHTLALNAGMQAVAAGEAGRGFSVVADEVQRLAETARESTDQIAGLVQSIQAESSETMVTMNKTIGQVVKGSEMAEKAGKRMRRTQLSTQELVAAVQQISERSKAQEVINEELRSQASALEQSTEATEKEMQEQTGQTENLFKYLADLVGSVRVFKLPKAA